MKKLFYKQRLKLPVWMQIYVIWWVILIIMVPLIFYWGTMKTGDFDSRRDIIRNPAFNNQTVRKTIQFIDQKLYPDGTFSTKALENEKITLGIQKWIIETKKQKVQNIECSYTSIFKPGTARQNIVLGIPLQDHGAIAKAAIVTMNSLNSINTKESIYYVFYNDHYRCFEGYNLVANIPGLTSTANFIFYSVQNSDKYGIMINGTLKNVSSNNWQFILPEFTKKPGILQQIGTSLSPIFQGPEGAMLSLGESAIGFSYPALSGEIKATIQIATDMRRLLQYFENNENPGIENHSFWISSSRAFTRNGFRILMVFLVILIWFPFINKRYNSRDRLEISRGIFAVIYYMLVPLFFFIGIKLTYDIGNASNYIIPLLILASLGLLFVFNRLEKNTLNFNTNPITGIFVLNLIFSITAILQPVLFMLLIPASFSLNRAIKSIGAIKLIWFFVGLIPMVIVLYNSAPEKHLNVLLEASFYLSTFFSDISNTTNSLLLVGGMVSVLRIKKKKR